jgi:hypothetical protein
MPDRQRLMDAVCIRCRRIVRREPVIDDSDDSVIQTKAEIVRDSLIPFDYYTDSPKPVTGHASGCQNRPQ